MHFQNQIVGNARTRKLVVSTWNVSRRSMLCLNVSTGAGSRALS